MSNPRSSITWLLRIFHSPVLVTSLIFLLWSCAISSRDAVVYHALEYPSPSRTKEPQSPISETLMIYKFLLSPSVESDSLVISESKGQDQLVRLHRWQENPADMVTDLILRDFQESGFFGTTVDQLSNTRYRYALEGTITNLRGILRDNKAVALIEVDATLTDFDPPAGAKKNIMTRRYSIEAPSSKSDPASIVRALNLALKDLSERLRNDVGEVLSKTRRSNSTDKGPGLGSQNPP
ncbi:MAG: ABC-type transport auxiliary lipoprotein family protein [Desulfomonile sp.]